MSELERIYDARHLPCARVRIAADEAERKALADRFGLVAIGRLAAEVVLTPDGNAVLASGTLDAAVVQSCAVSGDDLPVTIAEPIALRFVPAATAPDPDDEAEFGHDTPDEIEMADGRFDLGEAIAQSLALAIDPFAVGPEAERVRAEVLGNAEASGPFAALEALRRPK